MRDNTRDHAVELEDGSDLDEQRREIRARRLAGARTDARDLDVVCPADEERVLVLPVQRALEQVRARAVRRPVDECDTALRMGVIDLHAL